MKSMFKINTATNTAAVEKLEVVEKIKSLCGLTDEIWLHTMFDTGCRFVEMHIDPSFKANALLMDSEFGFWAWWISFYTQHDETLLDYVSVKTPKQYGLKKQTLLTLFEARKQFDHFLNAISKLHGIQF
jgi:hypothetical protein